MTVSKPKKRGEKFEGAGLFFASSKDGGATYSEAHLIKDDTCECCRLGLAFAFAGPVDRWSYSGTSSKAVYEITPSWRLKILRRPEKSTASARISGRSRRARIRVPSLAISQAGTYHVTWYTNGSVRKGLFYARSQDGGRTFSEPISIGRPDRNPSRPYVIAGPDGTAMVWKEFDGSKTTVKPDDLA